MTTVVVFPPIVVTSVKLVTSSEELDPFRERNPDGVMVEWDGGSDRVGDMVDGLVLASLDPLLDVDGALPSPGVETVGMTDDVVFAGEEMGRRFDVDVAVPLPSMIFSWYRESGSPLFTMNILCTPGESCPES